MNFNFVGANGTIAYDQGKEKNAQGKERLRFCVQELERNNPFFCLDYKTNVYKNFGYFNVAQTFIWANNGKHLRIWEIPSGRLASDFPVPQCFRPEYAPRDDLPPRQEHAKLCDQLVCGKNLAYVACAEGKQVNLYRLKKGRPERVLSKKVDSIFGVFILGQKKRLACVDDKGNIKSWPVAF